MKKLTDNNMTEFIYNNHLEAKKVLSVLEKELNKCEEFIFSIAFISESGLTALLQSLKNLEEKKINGKILTTNYLYFNTPKVFDKLMQFKNIELRIFNSNENNIGFHTKGYLFRTEGDWTALIGSANLTINALTINKEWNTLIKNNKEYIDKILEEFDKLWNNSIEYKKMREQYIVDYLNHSKELLISKETQIEKIEPNSMQKSFIQNFLKARTLGNKSLLISATGTGKTYACAFAMKELKAKKVLFIVHREQIAKEAMNTFKKVFSTERTYGVLSGKSKEQESDFVFSTIQSLSKDDILNQFDKSYFDEIIIDEVHRAGSASYQKVMSYFEPRHFLGMTASPDRMDGFNIYQLFDNNIVYEIRLEEALEQNMLCPFHYFGVSDLAINDEHVEGLKNFSKLVSEERVQHIIEKIEYYGYSGERVKGLVFCSSKEESKELSRKFNEKGYKTASLTGEDSQSTREQTVKKLESNSGGKLDYIFTVDIFNEGIDIPSVNQVIMLRPTQSAIVFIQQLGRGLRKHPSKNFVVVIDFIANYANNFLIPIALSGDRSYDKDTIRRFLSQGTRYLTGVSTIHFDNIAKERIYTAIDNVKLTTWLFVTNEYIMLKEKLGKIPTYYDFENSINVEKIFQVAGSYYNFLNKKEKDYPFKNKLNKIQENMLEYISTNLILSKKIEELIVLKLLLENKNNVEEQVRNIMLTKYNKFIAEYELDVIKKVLMNKFVTSSITAKKYNECVFLSEESGIFISEKFKMQLTNSFFKEILLELIDYGIYRYDKMYKNRLYKDTNFVLYEKYSFEDICKLFSWETNYVPLAIGGYKYDEKTKTLPIFINYDIDENSFNRDYVHGFLPNNMFTSMSKPRRNLSSKECEYFYREDTKIYLFMRKNKDDKAGARMFYFLGELKTVGKPKLVHREKSEDTVIQFFYKIQTPLREDIYEYFTREKI